MWTRALAIFLFTLAAQVSLATLESRDELFTRLQHAGYATLIEVPYSSLLTLRGNRPYLVETSHGHSADKLCAALTDLESRRLPVMDYIKSGATNRNVKVWMEATQLGDYLACFKENIEFIIDNNPNFPLRKDKLHSEARNFESCFIFPVQVEEVVERLELAAYRGVQ